MNVRDHVRPLELSGDELRELVATVTEHLARYVDTLETQPVKDLEGADAIARELSRPLPEKGTPLGEILDDLFERWIPKGFNPASPGYLAFIPGGGILHAGVADLIAATINRYVGVWTAAPPLARLEADVVRWFCDMVGYPAEAGGFLTTGGSLANLSAIVTARRARLPEDFLTGVIYASEQSHHSIHKAATLAGFPRRNLRLIPADRRCRIDPQALARAVDEDRAAGRTPFLICANAGTTNTGAIDDLPGLADFAEREELWLHVDAAYGGFFRLTERGRERLRGLERADSVVLDPHKTLFLPYGTGSLIVRDVESLRRAHSQRADYMPAMQEDPDQVDFCEISPELSRDFRGLRVWLPIAMHGIGPFRDNLDEKLDLIEWATAELHALAGVEVVAEPQLTVVAFRFVQPGLDAEELDAWNARCLEEINAGGRVLLTPTQLDGRFVIRICVVSFRTHADRVEECLAAIRAVAGAV
ncbi:MAG: aminotransferase class I/II-fold pyridoxal phosphate-dependent enzyme [bacterium]|nr:aminotransferase class I/II-fold pyridoxal phosphate-dependent enzyme [bacterium]